MKVVEIKKKVVTVGLPAKRWTAEECESFEEFVKCNGADLRRIFLKYGVLRG